MRKTVHRILAAVLAAVLLSTCAGAADYGSTVLAGALALSDTAALTTETQAGTGVKGLQENVVTYVPEQNVRPVVAFGSTLYGRSAMNVTAKYLADKGYSIVAGVNGAFFDMTDGIPYGLVVTDGVLRTSGNINSVGFFDSGAAVIGKPGLSVKLSTASGTPLDIFYNKVLTVSNGIGLYSNDYDTKTKNTVSAYNLVLQPDSQSGAELKLNGTVTARVVRIAEKTASCDIPAGCFVLSVAESSVYTSALTTMKSIALNDTLTITTATDPAWQNVLYACGGGDMLVENGAADSAFALDTAKKPVARTAVGLKQDGSLVLYTADYSASSAGLTLPELAQRMAELGCVTALNLDGGGSTAMGAQYPGYDTGATVNRPSDGSLRKCANFIFLVRKTTPAGDAAKLYLYPYHGAMLAGASLQMTLKAADAAYMTAAVPAGAVYTADSGTVNDQGVFTAGAAGTANVTATAGKLTAQTAVTVLSEPTSITLKKEKAANAFTSAMVPSGSVTDLTASALWYGSPVTAQDSCFTWSVSGAIGTVDANGVFTAAQVAKSTTGKIVVTCGTVSATADITVAPANPFADLTNHWSREYVNSLYFAGVLAGSTGSDGKLYYRPDDSMTRQEFIVSLIRFLGTDTSSFTSVKLPFDDAGQVASWAQAAVQTAYSLGYVGGSSSGKKLLLNPTATISRQEAMTILARSRALTSANAAATLGKFSDAAKVASWAQSPLAAMVEKGVISGSNGKLNPTGRVTRAEVAKMLYVLQSVPQA